MLSSDVYKKNVVGLVDEAHCVHMWLVNVGCFEIYYTLLIKVFHRVSTFTYN